MPEVKVREGEKKSLLRDILIPGNKTLNISELEEVFTCKGLDAKKLRTAAWKR